MSADFTPDIVINKTMGDFRFWVQKVLPLVYDDSLSYYELLSKLVEWMTNFTDNSVALLEAFKLLQDYVNNYFDNLDAQEMINNKLDEMANDGTLEALLEQVVNIAQVMTLNPCLSVSVYRGWVDQGDTTGNPNFLQSACTDGSYMYMFFVQPSNLQNALMKVYSLSSKRWVRDYVINNGYHANGCDYYNGTIYLATLNNTILEINPTNGNVTTTHTFDISFRSVSIDNDGTVYGASGNKLFVIDLNTDTYSQKCTLDFTNTAGYQSGVVRDKWLYEAGTNPSCVYRINVDSGLVSKIYPIDRYVDIYSVGEVETVLQDRTSGKYYVGSCSYYNFSNYRQGNIFECDFMSNIAPNRIYSGGSVLSVGGLYVDQSNTASGLPDGTNNNPFPCLSAALSAFNSPACETYKTFRIYLKSDCSDEIFYARNAIINLDGQGYKVGQIYCSDCITSITNVVVQKTNVSEASIAYPIYFNGCVVDLDGITINNDSVGGYQNYSGVFNESVGSWFNGVINNNLGLNSYRSNILFNIGIRNRVNYETANLPNMHYSSTTSTSQMNEQDITNVNNEYMACVRLSKGGKYTEAFFPLGLTCLSHVVMYVGGQLEFHDIRQTYDESSGYSYEVTQSRALAGVSSTGAITYVETTPVTLGAILYVSRV